MKTTAYTLLLFFICLNLSLYLIHETQVFPSAAEEPWESPDDIWSRFSTSVGLLGVVAIVAVWTKNPYLGIAGLTLWVADVFLPIVNWVFFGLPNFITAVAGSCTTGAAELLLLANVIQALTGAVWFWFILGFLSQRVMET